LFDLKIYADPANNWFYGLSNVF